MAIRTDATRRGKAMRAIIVFLLAAGMLQASIAACSGVAHADEVRTLTDIFGITREQVVDWLESHEHDDYYLGTPYRPYDWRSPNGDINGWGAASDGATAGMNCTGFVWHALCAAHGWGDDVASRVPALQGWVDAIRNESLVVYYYDSKEAMLADGKLETGDIIWMFDKDAGEMDGISDFHHVGIFWGGSPSDDRLWHSVADDPISWSGSNRITEIHAKAASVLYVVIKTEPEPEKGYIDLLKLSATPSITDYNACYSTEGARYDIFDAEGAWVHTMTTNPDGWAVSPLLDTGWYSVKEASASRGYMLDTSEYRVEVKADQTTRVNGGGGAVLENPLFDQAMLWVRKVDFDTVENMPQGGASLAGAEFKISYYDGFYSTTEKSWIGSANPTRSWVVRTDEQGCSVLTDSYKVSGDKFYYGPNGAVVIPLGTVTVQEVKAPSGYLSDSSIYIQQIGSDGSEPKMVTYYAPTVKEQIIRGGVRLQKLDSQSGITPQGDAGFGGISFEIVSDNANPVVVDGTAFGKGDVVKTLVTDSAGYASTDEDALPYGDYLLREAASNPSYRNTSSPIGFSIRTNREIADLSEANASGFYDEVVRGGVSVLKLDCETMLNAPLGSASVDGAVFNIVSRNPNPVLVDGIEYADGQTVKTIRTENGVATTDSDALPYGTYEIHEVAAPSGYLVSEKTQVFSIREHGIIVELVGDRAVADLVIRGDLEFVKIEADTMKRMASVPFEIRSKTTDESHVVVTDENGFCSTSSTWNAHSSNTNRGETDSDGVWFGLAIDGTTAPVDDCLGALPFDTYLVTELPCEANKGKLLVSFEVVIKRNMVTVDIGTITNGFGHTVELSKLAISGEEEVPGAHFTLIRLGDGKTIDSWVSSTEPYVIEDVEPGTYELAESEAPVGYALSRDSVVFTVFDSQPIIQVAMENNIIPEIGTSAVDADSGTHEMPAHSDAKIIDTVSFSKLVPGVTYTLDGVLMDKDSGKPLLFKGEEVTGTVEFVPTEPEGTVTVEFAFDAEGLAGASLVAFEHLYQGDILLASHTDIEDGEQTVRIVAPRIDTPEIDNADRTAAVVANASPKTGDTAETIIVALFAVLGITGTVIARLFWVGRRKYRLRA